MSVLADLRLHSPANDRSFFWNPEARKTETFIIIGLGNPGPEYAHTRHNAGFDTMSLLEERYRARIGRKMLKGLLTEVTDGAKKIVLCRPQTYMNSSGECAESLINWYRCPLDHMLVICDDIDLPTGKIRMRKSGGPGTHNGMRSIVQHVPGPGFPRIRIGTGAPPEGFDLIDWVLGRYQTEEEQELMCAAFAKAAACAADWVENGAEHAMQIGNAPEIKTGDKD